MSSGHDNHDNHSNEPKTVSFRTPMILALVTVLLIVLAVSTCDKKHGCCEDGTKCEEKAGEHGGHEQTGHEEHATEHNAASTEATETHETSVADSVVVKVDTAAAKTTAVKVEEHAAHH